MPRKSIEGSTVVVSAILMALACATARTEKSTGTNWYSCRTDEDCASVPGATCGDRDYCVDEDGKPVEVPVTDAGGQASGGGGGSGGASNPLGNGGSGNGGSGNGGSGNDVDCKAPPRRETDAQAIATVSGYQAQVTDGAVAGDGTVGVLWQEFAEFANSPERQTLLFSRQQPGSAWSQPEQVVATTDWSLTANLARPFSPNRPTVVFWAQGDGRYTSLKAARRAEDETWKEMPVIVETTNITSHSGVVDSKGNLTVVWTETDSDAPPSLNVVRASTFLAESGSWTTPEKLTTGADAGYIDGPMVQILDNDSVVVLWSGAPTGWATWSNVYDPTRKAWGGAAQLSRNGEYRASLSSSGDRALAVWAEQNSGTPVSLFAARYEDGRWSRASTVQVEAPDADYMTSAITPGGDALAVWQIADSTERLTYSAYRVLDGTWGEPALLEYPGADRPFPLSVTWVDCKQAFLATWREYAAVGIYSAWYTLDDGWSNIVPPRNPTSAHAVDTWGNLLSTWYDRDDKKVYFQTLTP
jgi:hypothetical protein